MRITPKNLHRQKMSTLFESVLQDLKLMKRKGIKIDMNHWTNVNSKNVCTVCLGGAAISGFLPSQHCNVQFIPKLVNGVIYRSSFATDNLKVNGLDLSPIEQQRLDHMSAMFNAWRADTLEEVVDHYSSIKAKDSQQIFWKIDKIRKITKTLQLDWDKYKGKKYFKGKVKDDTELVKSIKAFIKILKAHKL